MPLTDPSHDLALLTAMRAAGDGSAAAADAFNALYRRHQGPLFRYALLRSAREDVAADIVQDVFLGLMTNTFKFDAARGSLQPFLFGVARNLLLKRDEAARRFVSTTAKNDDDKDAEDFVAFVADDSTLPEQHVLANEAAEQVRHALMQVAPHYRDVLILYEIHDLSYVEIAHICGIDLGTVRSRLSRARAKLTELLESTRPHKHTATGSSKPEPLITGQALPIASFIKNNNDEYQRNFQRDFDHG
jgi:RNA polymerase sigma-70 factor, ECF subfamily